MTSTIYQASDLAQRRREFIDEARKGCARLRDTDGAHLVMVPSGTFEVLVGLRDWLARDLRLELVLQRPWSERRPVEFGDLAWLSVFDDDDQMEFHRELHEALMLSLASDALEPVDRCLREWRTTAVALADETRRAVLTGAVSGDEFEDVGRPV
ncbi:MAG: hypothetical protein ACRDY7_17265 [Acidimicrobiia bacterium]